MGMPTWADIFSSTVKYFIMKSYRNYSECSIVMCSSGVKKFVAEKRHVEFAKNRCGKKKELAFSRLFLDLLSYFRNSVLVRNKVYNL